MIQKVFCVGFQKTGTSSLRDALKLLGYRVTGVFGRDLDYTSLKSTYIARGLQSARKFDAVEDVPWPLMFRELDIAFPNSKFVLTVRDTDAWYRSISNHFGPVPQALQQLTYGEDAPSPIGHEDRYRAVYEAHNESVCRYFADDPLRLLIMDLEKGDGWKELGDFLGREDVPSGRFIHTNSAKQRKSLFNRAKRKLVKLGIPFQTMDG